jgi:mono/diheme cytochrome c family protein
MLIALVLGGLVSTAAWMYQSDGQEMGTEVEAAGTPIAPVISPPVQAREETPTGTDFAPNAEAGREVFAQFCDSCHPGGGQGVGPAVRGADFQAKYADDAAIRKVITEGTGRMPGFRQLRDKQVDDLIAYMRTLQ